jgi:hypothetical protein
MDYSELPTTERVEEYRKFAEEALRLADKATVPEAALYLRLAGKWLELARLISKRMVA